MITKTKQKQKQKTKNPNPNSEDKYGHCKKAAVCRPTMKYHMLELLWISIKNKEQVSATNGNKYVLVRKNLNI